MGTSLCRRWYEPSSCMASCSTTPITCTTNSSLQFFPQPIVARRARATHQKPRRATKKGTYAPQYDSHSRRMSGVFPHQAHARGDIGDGPRAVARHGTRGAVPHALSAHRRRREPSRRRRRLTRIGPVRPHPVTQGDSRTRDLRPGAAPTPPAGRHTRQRCEKCAPDGVPSWVFAGRRKRPPVRGALFGLLGSTRPFMRGPRPLATPA